MERSLKHENRLAMAKIVLNDPIFSGRSINGQSESCDFRLLFCFWFVLLVAIHTSSKSLFAASVPAVIPAAMK